MFIQSNFQLQTELGLQGLDQVYRKIADVKKDLTDSDVETNLLFYSIKTEEIIFPFGSTIPDDGIVIEDEEYLPTYIKIQKSLIGSGYGSKLEIIFGKIDEDTRELDQDTIDVSVATTYDKSYSEEFRNLCFQALCLPLEAFSWQLDHVSNLYYSDTHKAPIYNPTAELASSVLNKIHSRLNLLNSLVTEKYSEKYNFESYDLRMSKCFM